MKPKEDDDNRAPDGGDDDNSGSSDEGNEDNRGGGGSEKNDDTETCLNLLASMGFDPETSRRALDHARRHGSGNTTFTEAIELMFHLNPDDCPAGKIQAIDGGKGIERSASGNEEDLIGALGVESSSSLSARRTMCSAVLGGRGLASAAEEAGVEADPSGGIHSSAMDTTAPSLMRMGNRNSVVDSSAEARDDTPYDASILPDRLEWVHSSGSSNCDNEMDDRSSGSIAAPSKDEQGGEIHDDAQKKKVGVEASSDWKASSRGKAKVRSPIGNMYPTEATMEFDDTEGKKDVSDVDNGVMEVKTTTKENEGTKWKEALPEVADAARAEDGERQERRGGTSSSSDWRLESSFAFRSADGAAGGRMPAGGASLLPAPELVPPTAPPVERTGMELFGRSGRGQEGERMLLSPFPLPAEVGPSPSGRRGEGTDDNEGGGGTSDSSATPATHVVSPPSPEPPHRGEEGDEGTAFSAYVVPGRRRREDGGRPTTSGGGAVPGPSTEEPVYDGVPLSNYGKESVEEEATKRRRRRRTLGALAILVILAAIVAAMVLIFQRKRVEPDSQDSLDIFIPIINRPPLTSAPTLMPSSPQSSDRFLVFRSMLTLALASRGMPSELLDDPSSPQGAALRWIAYDDERDVLNLSGGENDKNANDLGELSVQQRFALATLYFSTGGPDTWVDKHNFLSPEHECEWNSPGTENSFIWGVYYKYVGVFCTNDAKVEQVIIIQNNLTGILPEEIGLLNSLADISIVKNDKLRGHIPSTFLNLPRLQFLLLFQNSLTGPVPEYNGTFSLLQKLRLENNALSSTIPSTLSQLNSLTHLYLAYNQLTGSVPSELGELSGLEEVFLDFNALTALFDPLPGRFPSLIALSMDSNFVTHIPISLFEFDNLTHLYLANNHISGFLPSEVSHLTKIQHFTVWNNFLEGALPDSLWEMTSLRNLFLGANQFNGTLSLGVGNLTTLNYLRLDGNKLSSTLPNSLGLLTNLVELGVNHNKFTGWVPDPSIARLQSLDVLYLHNNSLTGDLPSLCDLGLSFSMADCFAGDNNIRGPEMRCQCCTVCCLDGTRGPVYGCFPND